MTTTRPSAARGSGAESDRAGPSYGLRYQVLSPIEVLGQSIANIAPTATPTIVIPLVYGAAGQGTAFSYLFAMVAVLLVSLSVGQFARRSASPGSIYTYVAMGLGPSWGIAAGWTLLIAYIGCASSVASGFTNYVNVLLKDVFAPREDLTTPWMTMVMWAGVAGAWLIAYKDIKLSARLSLVLELLSLLFIVIVVAATLIHRGAHFDSSQLLLDNTSPGNLRLGLVLAIFSFTGFESSASLGSEASTPLRAIPRAIIQSSIMVGVFFILTSYTEIVGFAEGSVRLEASDAPLQVLATRAGIGLLGTAITIGAIVSFFACILASINSAARILFLMSRHGVISASFGDVHTVHQTPHVAVAISAVLSFLPAGALAWFGVRMFDIYGLIGTTATIGFIVSYILVSVAAPIYLYRRNELRALALVTQIGAVAFMTVALAGAVYPLPDVPARYPIYAFILLAAIGILWGGVLHVRAPSVRVSIHADLAAISARFPEELR